MFWRYITIIAINTIIIYIVLGLFGLFVLASKKYCAFVPVSFSPACPVGLLTTNEILKHHIQDCIVLYYIASCYI